jgi:thiamine pyrophosphate-dependent acetolactate synthase large subunit-like protein
MVLPTPLQAFSGVPKATAHTDKQTIVDGEKMTGAQALVRSLEDLEVHDVFGIPGGAILPVYHAINDDTRFRFILTRHEQGAGHAAEGYAIATGRVGVCIVTSGPGATNMVTAIADATMDSVPMLVITGQVGVDAIGTDAFQGRYCRHHLSCSQAFISGNSRAGYSPSAYRGVLHSEFRQARTGGRGYHQNGPERNHVLLMAAAHDSAGI